MATPKKKAAAVDYTHPGKRNQLKRIDQFMDTTMSHSVSCFCCGTEDGTEYCTPAEYAQELYEEGWRVIASKSCDGIGIACPKCVALPDDKRGED